MCAAAISRRQTARPVRSAWSSGRAGPTILTNAHVATDPGVAPGPIGSRLPNCNLVPGSVIRLDNLGAPLIRSDAALVRMPASSVAPGEFHGVPLTLRNCGDIANNDPRRFFYVGGRLRARGALARLHAGRDADQHRRPFASLCRFPEFDVKLGQCRPGHSGAVVFCELAAG